MSTEVGPWSKTGGLADVMASLPQALAERWESWSLLGRSVLTYEPIKLGQ